MTQIGTALNLEGEVFSTPDKRVAIAVPPIGIPHAVRFRVSHVYPADLSGQYPEWADMQVGSVPCRINPEIITPPYFRLADCVWLIHLHGKDLPSKDGEGRGMMFGEPGNEEEYRFWRTNIGPLNVIMIDTAHRISLWS